MEYHSQQNELSEPDRDDLVELLAPVFGIEPAAPGFRAKLGEQLDREYAPLFCHQIDAACDQGSSDEDSALHSSGENALAGIRSQRWLKWGLSAACLLVTLSWWTTSSSYSWASMVASLEQSEWIQILAELPAGQRAEGWFSGEHRVVAFKSEKQFRFDDHANGTRLLYALGEKAVSRREMTAAASNLSESQLVTWLLSVLGGTAADRAEQANSMRLISESWRHVDGGGVALQVRLSVGMPAREVTIEFDLDPKTQLPLQAKIVGAATDKGKIEFSYPVSGPPDIYTLGVSRELPTLASEDFDRMSPEKRVVHSDMGKSTEVDDRVVLRPVAPLPRPEMGKSANTPLAPPPKKAKKKLPPPRSVDEMSRRVDELLRQHWTDKTIQPVAPAADEEFLRRVYLDFTGRIPTVNEVRTFLSDARSDRRERLLDDLLDRYDHASHLAAVWRSFLIPETADLTGLGGVQDFEAWLTERFHDKQPYDKMVSDLLLAEGRAQSTGPLLFYAALKLKPEEIARQTSRAFLGMRLECAQCHDHFFDEHWKQRDFWAYAAFFARISQPEGKLDRVSPVLRVRDISRGEVVLPETDEVIPPRFPFDAEPVPDVQEVSRRQVLVTWLTSPDNPQFARATVNRVWSHLFGLGLVNPVDDMNAANMPICSELLSELAEYFVHSDYDLRRLYATLARTDAYQLSSSSTASDPTRTGNFAQMNVKCFTAEQIYDCISIATRVDSAAAATGLNRLNNSSRQAFLEQFRAPPGNNTEYQAGIAQALTLINGSLLHSATRLQTCGLLRSLQAPFFTDDQRVETLFLATVSRPPREVEKKVVLNGLKSAKTDQERAIVLGDALWALLNSAEFTLIH